MTSYFALFLLVFNRYRKRRVHNTANLLTGESDVAPGTIKVPQGKTDVVPDVISYYHPNLTINLVEDYTAWTKGAIPQPLDKCEFIPYSACLSDVISTNQITPLLKNTLQLSNSTLILVVTTQFYTSTVIGTWHKNTCLLTTQQSEFLYGTNPAIVLISLSLLLSFIQECYTYLHIHASDTIQVQHVCSDGSG